MQKGHVELSENKVKAQNITAHLSSLNIDDAEVVDEAVYLAVTDVHQKTWTTQEKICIYTVFFLFFVKKF